jgi:hypothetical protein
MSTIERIAWLETEIARIAGFRHRSAASWWQHRELVEEWTALRAIVPITEVVA